MQETFLYQLDEVPPIHKNLIYGLQWVMIKIPSIVIFSTLCSVALGLDPAARISFSQRLLIVTGLMTLLQSLKGHRYPVVEGPSSALLLSFLVLAPYGLPAIEGGLIIGGLLLMAVGKFKWFKWLAPFFNSNVIGVILMLVAMTLLPFTAALLIGIVVTTLIGIPMGVTHIPENAAFFALPDFSNLAVGALDIRGALKMGIWTVVFTFTFVELFDVDADLLDNAAKRSPSLKPGKISQAKMRLALQGMTQDDKDTFLLRLLNDEPRLSLALHRHLGPRRHINSADADRAFL